MPSRWRPPGFKVDLYADGLSNPRLIRTAPNGDLVPRRERAPARSRSFAASGPDGRAAQVERFASGLNKPFGIAFYPPGNAPQWVYVAQHRLRRPLPLQERRSSGARPGRDGGLRSPAAAASAAAGTGRATSPSRATARPCSCRSGRARTSTTPTATPPSFTAPTSWPSISTCPTGRLPDGKNLRVYAWGIRNAVGIAVHPQSGELWASVNERDLLGDNLVPDYITHVEPGGFYGWPWYYIGGHQDPRHAGKHPELAAKVIVPDVLLQPHDASLEMTFYDGAQFPAAYRGDIFAAQHGSWNRKVRSGYEVVRVPMHGRARATGEYEDFLTGFVTPAGRRLGPSRRRRGRARTARLMVTDDGSNAIWRVSYVGKK